MAQGATKLRYSKEEQDSALKQPKADSLPMDATKLMEFAFRMGQGSVSHSPTEAASSRGTVNRKPSVPQLALEDDPNRGAPCPPKTATQDRRCVK